jgi:hypothetical protein
VGKANLTHIIHAVALGDSAGFGGVIDRNVSHVTVPQRLTGIVEGWRSIRSEAYVRVNVRVARQSVWSAYKSACYLAHSSNRVRARPDRGVDGSARIWAGQADRACALEVAGSQQF